MIVIDTNLLLYAYNPETPQHERSRTWLEGLFEGEEAVALPWVVIFGFIRIGTDPRVHGNPLTTEEAAEIVTDWLTRRNVVPLSPGPRHWEIVRKLLIEGQARGPLAMDAHIAAHALEHGAALATNDRDYTRFEGLRLLNPVAPTSG